MAAKSNGHETYVTLAELANQLGMPKSNARKYILGLGYRFDKRRTANSQNQLANTLSRETAEQVVETRLAAGYGASSRVVDDSTGHFYVVRLVPDLDLRRIKLGFAIDVTQRLDQHRTAAPTAELLYSWPCKRVWDQAVMDALAVNCEHIRNEVYTCPDVDALKARGDALFALLPNF